MTTTTDTDTTPRPRSSAAQRRPEVLQAAIAEFAAGGLDGASTESIARRAGISHAYLFRLFGTKRELFTAALEHSNARILAAFAAGLKRRKKGEPVQAALGRGYRRLLRDRDELRFGLFVDAVAASDPEVRRVARACYRRIFRWVQDEAGLSADEARLFLAQGLVLAVAEAIDFPEMHDRGEWLARITVAAGYMRV